MLVVRKFNPIYSNQAPAFPSSSSSSDLPRTWSSLIKSANTLHRNLGGSALIFSLIPYSLILTYTCFHRCLYLSPILSVSHLLFSSHFLLSVSDAVFLSFSNTLYIFLSVCFSLALILCLPYYLLAPCSL